jgi:hypothetical protein
MDPATTDKTEEVDGGVGTSRQPDVDGWTDGPRGGHHQEFLATTRQPDYGSIPARAASGERVEVGQGVGGDCGVSAEATPATVWCGRGSLWVGGRVLLYRGHVQVYLVVGAAEE